MNKIVHDKIVFNNLQINFKVGKMGQSKGTSHLTFIIDSNTYIFPTQKFEDVSALNNRVTLLEVHDTLMQLNLKLLPFVKVFQALTIFNSVGLLIGLLLALIMIISQNGGMFKIILIYFGLLQFFVICKPLMMKITYYLVIHNLLRDHKEFYASKGLKWKIKSSLFKWKNGPCWLELHLDSAITKTKNNKELAKPHFNVKGFVEGHNNSSAPMMRPNWELTLGPSTEKDTSICPDQLNDVALEIAELIESQEMDSTKREIESTRRQILKV